MAQREKTRTSEPLKPRGKDDDNAAKRREKRDAKSGGFRGGVGPQSPGLDEAKPTEETSADAASADDQIEDAARATKKATR